MPGCRGAEELLGVEIREQSVLSSKADLMLFWFYVERRGVTSGLSKERIVITKLVSLVSNTL